MLETENEEGQRRLFHILRFCKIRDRATAANTSQKTLDTSGRGGAKGENGRRTRAFVPDEEAE